MAVKVMILLKSVLLKKKLSKLLNKNKQFLQLQFKKKNMWQPLALEVMLSL
jgi:hypothetical protein